MPPNTAAVKALRPGRKPIVCCTVPRFAAYITPASAASTAPITNVKEITWSGFTPISAAAFGFSAVARMARPMRVLFTRNISPTSVTTVSTRIRICTVLMTAPPMLYSLASSRIGNGFGLGFQMIMASVCSSSDTPIAVISGARRGALRSGR